MCACVCVCVCVCVKEFSSYEKAKMKETLQRKANSQIKTGEGIFSINLSLTCCWKSLREDILEKKSRKFA